MTGEHWRGCAPCEEGAQEKLYPACRVGLGLVIAGLVLAFIGVIFSFWLTLLGAALLLAGYLVIRIC